MTRSKIELADHERLILRALTVTFQKARDDGEYAAKQQTIEETLRSQFKVWVSEDELSKQLESLDQKGLAHFRWSLTDIYWAPTKNGQEAYEEMIAPDIQVDPAELHRVRF